MHLRFDIVWILVGGCFKGHFDGVPFADYSYITFQVALGSADEVVRVS